MIHVVLPCCKADENQAIALLEWISELGPNSAKFFLLCPDECQHDKMLEIASRSFAYTKWIRDAENLKSDWREIGNHVKSAAGPNSLFRQAAWYFHIVERGPWLFLEPDAIPCGPNWLKELSDEYYQCGKPFMGFRVNRKTHPGDVGLHMSGVAIYHPDTPGMAVNAVLAGDTAFDIAGAVEFEENMHNSPRIFHRYRPPTFDNQEDFDQRVSKHLSIYHSCKDGSIFKFLRQRLGMPSRDTPLDLFVPRQVIDTPSTPEWKEAIRINDQAISKMGLDGPFVDIFIKTREHDHPWLEWCIKSITQFASGFRRTVLLDDKTDPWFGNMPGIDQKSVEPKEPGYLWQQVCKLYADEKTDAEFILYMDSDCVFTRSTTPQEFIRNGKAIWQYTPLDQARPDQHHWIGVMEKFLGKRPEHEFMRRHPFIVQRWMLEALRTFCKYRHGKSLESYILGEADPSNGLSLRFSEWNCLGFFLWEYHRDRVEWVLDADAGPACTWQGHTHDTPEKNAANVAKMREIFLGSTPSQQGAVGDGFTRPPLSLEEAIAFIESKGGAVQMPRNPLKRTGNYKGRPKGSKNKPKPTMVVSAPKKDSLLLAIHSYPGANETFARHWPSYQKSGATRIVGIGTTDHGCEFPCESVEIGENSYMKMKGKDDHLCRRLIDTVKWCLTQPENRFIISEYDTIWLRKMPHCTGINAHKTGGQVNGSLTHSFSHNPWIFDRESGPVLLAALAAVLDESGEYPNNSPDLFFGLACERARIEVGCPWKMFTRNSLDSPGDLDLAVQSARDGVHVIHGVKMDAEYFSIMEALNGKHLELSHAR